ncbi:MAG: crotonobetainyl-CoA:carnitine CoA-transferase CaiB-like acyl-CoA transferase, partial [Gammaproteobacteria bacterium]
MSEEQVIPANIPLAGVKVVELGTSVAAPYAGWILAALGADVVKIERPDGGDDARQWGTVLADGSSSYYNAFNRDKRGITIDIKSDEEREWLRTYCVEQADVVIQN